MENQNDDSETNAKVSDSAYSNSCSNSQSRRSNSSKSTHSGSNSSGSSGYGGKESSGSSVTKTQSLDKKLKDKEPKKKNKIDTAILEVPLVVENRVIEENRIVNNTDDNQDFVMDVESSQVHEVENMDISLSEKASPKTEAGSYDLTNKHSILSSNETKKGFSCVISMNDGVVMFTTSWLTNSLGFPKDMWLGRSFLDFLHPKDRNTFASQITHDLVSQKNIKDLQGKVQFHGIFVSSMFCRIRKYRSLGNSGFNIKDSAVTYLPFSLKLSLKDLIDDSGKETYLVIQATPCVSAFKVPNQPMYKATPFVIRHTAAGHFAYLDPESVTYLGYLPQDMVDQCVLHLYHPDDLKYLHRIYETIVKEGTAPRSDSFRIMAQNGDYVKIETEWSSFINPWSRKLEFVIGKHHVVEGPKKPDIFLPPPSPERATYFSEEQNKEIQSLRNGLIRIMNEVLTKPDEVAKQEKSKRCRDLTVFMESLIHDSPKPIELKAESIQEQREHEHSFYEHDSVMLGGISPHHENTDSKSSTETPLSYNQLNYNDNLERYFESRGQCSFVDDKADNMTDKELSRSTGSDIFDTGLAISSGDELMSSGETNFGASTSSESSFADDHKAHLTEYLLTKHNFEMEKELIKKHREMRITISGEKENKASNETQKKKTLKEHLARCNAAFQATDAQPHGIKRGSHHFEREFNTTKHHKGETSSQPVVSRVTTVTTSTFQTNSAIPEHNKSVQRCTYDKAKIESHRRMLNRRSGQFDEKFAYKPTCSGVAEYSVVNYMRSTSRSIAQYGTQIPRNRFISAIRPSRYYHETNPAPVTLPAHIVMPMINNSHTKNYAYQFQEPTLGPVSLPVQYVMCPHPMYAIHNQHLSIPAPEKLTNNKSGHFHNMTCNNSRSMDLTYKHYPQYWAQEDIIARAARIKSRTSYGVNNCNVRNTQRRKVDPPWMDQVCASSDLLYKYQVNVVNKEITLSENQEKVDQIIQPVLVDEQLGQYYLDMQLAGFTARLSLEEASNSSSSSGEDTTSAKELPLHVLRHSMASIIYQEDAPLPSPDSDSSNEDS